MVGHKGVFTTGDVARICQVAPRTVSKWFDSGRLKGYRVPGSKDRRIPLEDLIRFMRRHGMPLGSLDTGSTRVLVVVPDPLFRESLVESLNSQRWCECTGAESPFSAGVVAARMRPHVIIVDAATPDLRRADLCKAARSSEALQEAKIIALTHDRAACDQFKREGYDDCLVRPFEVTDIVRAIDTVTGD